MTGAFEAKTGRSGQMGGKMTNDNQLPRPARQRNRWMIGGSALAAASALSLLPGQALAQGRPELLAMSPPVLSALPPARQLPRVQMPQDVRMPAEHQVIPATTIATRAYVDAAGIALDAPTVSVLSVAGRPTGSQEVPTQVPAASAQVIGRPISAVNVPFSSTPAPSNGDTNTAGINVAASANYFASEINFTPGTSSDVVNVLANSAIINWTTNAAGTAGGQVTFLGTGSQLDFTSNLTDYTVLNRIFTPTIDAAVRIDGTVNSSAISGSPGGNIWFYSPGGLIIGASSTFNVGSLVLTSSNLNSIGSTMDFTGVAEPDTAVVIEAGAQISALGPNSYFAVVAPRVEQGGTVNVDGSAAYVGAEQAQLTINNGLFDISVGVGSADANGVVHTGSTTGAAATPTINAFGQITDADARGIYMVAVPKNTAISMLVGGTIGYQPAMAASLADNGSIILSAGAGTVAGGSLASPTGQVDVANAVPGGNVVIDGATFTSSAEVFASNDVTLAPSSIAAGSDGRGAYDLDVTAGGNIGLSLAGSDTISVDGDLTLTSGGDIDVDLTSTSGTLVVGGNFVLSTLTLGADDFFTVRNNGGNGVGADAVSGAINLTIGGGSNLDVGGNLFLNSAAQGGKGEIQNGLATAGDIVADFSTTGSVDIGGFLLITAQAVSAQAGKIGGNGPGGIGSDSTGGNVTLNFGGSGISAAGMFVDASADASSGDNSGVAQSNDAIAGAVSVNVFGGFNQFGNVNLISQANAADSFDAAGVAIVGQATRGSVNLALSNIDAFLGISGDAFIDVSTDGAIGAPVGAPVAGAVSITVSNVGTSGGLFVDGTLGINTAAGGGAGTGVTAAGSVLLQATDGQIFASFLDISANASESGRDFGLGGNGQDFRGGDVTLRANTNGRIDLGFAFINSEATGAVNSAGDATGGAITLEANDGAIAFQNFANLIASAAGGSGSDPVDGGAAFAQGGDITLSVSGAGGSLDLGDIFIAADASILFDVESGSGEFSGDGGSAVAGDVVFNLGGGSLTANSMLITSNGRGGIGGALPPGMAAFSTGLPSAGDGGSGQGGEIIFNLDGTDMTVGSLDILADGIGGAGSFGDFEAGTRGGDGGDAVGGTVVFNALSGTLNAGSITVAARGNTINGGGAGGNAAGSEGGNGGNATGGSATFNLNGSATITAGTVLVTTDGFGGRGGDSFATIDALSNILPSQAAGNGGNGTGGTSAFNHTSGDISFISLTTSAAGIGGDGGGSAGFTVNDSSDAGGSGGVGTGGSAVINLNQDDNTDPAYVVNASGTGGNGGAGLVSGNGGAAAGGAASLVINNVAISLDSATIDATATGGNAGFVDNFGGTAGLGGDAVGGTATLLLNGAATSLSSGFPLAITASAAGGNGGNGSIGDATQAGGDGGAGGDATGGTAQVLLAGTGASLVLSPLLATISAGGIGGAGGAGGGNFQGGTAGNGGNGGDGTGGTGLIEARSGTVLTLDGGGVTFNLSIGGQGGNGGNGGDIDMISGGVAGDGGDGGTGVGGSPTLRAVGGTISGAAVNVGAIGTGGTGGTGGTDFTVVLGTDGNGGNGVGGTPLFELLNGSPGIISLGDLTVNANGIAGTGTISGIDASGLVTFRDLSTEAGGVFSFGALTVDATGFAAGPTGGGLVFIAGSGTGTVAGDMNVNVTGDITYAFDGTGQIVVGGASLLNATGNILITHTNNAGGIASIDSSGNFTAFAGLDFIADGQSIVTSGNTIAVRAEGEAEANDLQAVSVIDFSAGQNATVNNASVTGPAITVNLGAGTIVLNGIAIRAGGDNDPSFEQFDPTYSATITGDVTSTGFISVTAGGNAVFAAGSNTVSDNGLTVRTGDDILIASGALVEAGANPATTPNPALPFSSFNNLVLDAGALARSGELFTTPLTPIGSIVSAGTIAANDFAVILNANAIDGTGGTISAGSMAADIVDAPSNAFIAAVGQSDDNGLLSAQCLQGNICLGSLSADNQILIGQNSNNDVIQLIVEQATITANDVLITIRNDIVMGSDGIPTTINAANTFLAESLTGDVNLLDAVITSNQITISAAGSLLGTGSLTSANDIGITVGQDLNALLIDTGGQLTTATGVGGALETEYTVPGAINVGTYTQGAATPLRVVAGGGNSFGAINLAGTQDITLIAGNAGAGDVFLGAATGAGNIDLSGDNAGFGPLTAAGSITVTAAAGNIDAAGTSSAGGGIALSASGDIDFDSLSAAGGDFNADAGGAIAFTDAAASGTLGFSAGGSIVAAGSVNAGGVFLGSGDTISVPVIVSGSFMDVFGPNGVTLGSITGASAFLQALSGAVSVSDDIDLTGLLEAEGRSVLLRSTNGLTVRAVATAGDIDIEVAGDLDLRGINATGDIILTTTGGSMVVNETVMGTMTALPPGAQGPLMITSSGGNVDITAANDFTVNAAVSAANALTINVGGTIGLLAETSGATIDVVAGDINIGAAGSLGRSDLTSSIVITTAGDILLGGAGGGSPTTGLMQIDNGEFSRIFSGGDLTIGAAIGATGVGGNMTIDTLDVLVGTGAGTPQDGNIGPSGGLFLEAAGSMNVIGVATMTNAGTDSLFSLLAGQSIDVDTVNGAIIVQNANGALAGQLELVAPTIQAISDAAALDITGATIADIDLRLGQNDGAVIDTGYFSAAELFFTVEDALLIQNSGGGTAFDDRRGFTANAVTIDSANPAAVIVINGTVDGLTGIDALNAAGVPGQFDPGSTINGCLILNTVSCSAIFDDPGPKDPVRDLIDEEIDPRDQPGDEGDGDLGGILVEMREPTSLREDPLLDDPVTGAGNEDLWVSGPDCEGVDADSEACEAEAQ